MWYAVDRNVVMRSMTVFTLLVLVFLHVVFEMFG